MSPHFVCVKQILVTKKLLLGIFVIVLLILVLFRSLEFQKGRTKNVSAVFVPVRTGTTSNVIVTRPGLGDLKNPRFNESSAEVISSPDDQACKIPQLSPFGPDTVHIMDNVHSPSCLTNKNLRFRINYQNELVLVNMDQDFFRNVSCFYTPVLRDPDRSDFHYQLNTIIYALNSSVTELKPDLEHIQISCSKNGKKIYEDYLSAVQVKPELEKELSRSRKFKEFYSVMIIGQDSVSNMNFKRYMPLTHEYLVEDMGAVEFSGFNSLGPGTLWSVFALYTGLDLNQYRDLCWRGESGYRDKCPHIWKEFAAQGYRTAYDEDKLANGIFNEVGKSGFETPQFHYDFRTVSNLLDHVTAGHVRSDYCYGSRLSFSVLMENMCKMATTFTNKPFWSFMWAQSLSHSLSNSLIKYGDKSMAESLQYLNTNQLLNNTILIVFSDHGQRYGTFRKNTRQGFLEERLPLLYVVLPKKFREKFPRGAKNMEENAGKLTTAFDVYEMMRDLLNLTQLTDKVLEAREHEANINSRRKVSLFLPINPRRTCAMIGFSFIYCACLHQETLSTNDSGVKTAAEFVLESVNKNLSAYPQCHKLRLKNITQAFKLRVKISRKDEYDRFEMNARETDKAVGEHFQIGLETEPGNGAFDVSVFKPKNGVLRVEDAIRVTAYDNIADCMPVKALRPFCICKSKLVS